MNFSETIALALNSLKANKLRSGLTILGIVIGVFSVILLVALVSGLKSFITEQIASLGPNVMYVVPGKIGGGRGPGGIQTNRLTLQDANNLKLQLSNEARVTVAVQGVTTVKYKNKSSSNVTLVGVQANYLDVVKAISIERGRPFSQSEADSGKRVALVGPTILENLGVQDILGIEIIVGNQRFKAIGVMSERGSNLGLDLDNFIAVPLIPGQRLLGEDKVHNIIISANENSQVGKVQEKAKEVLRKRLKEDDFTIQTQEQTLSTIGQITNVLTIALGGIAAISLLVGGIGVMNIMLVSVTERTREIGLRKALGAKNQDIRNQFIIEAVTLTCLGGIIGIVLGIGASLVANIFIETTITWWSIALSFGFSVIVGVIFGVAPAIRASRMNPIQALRYE